ncbi:MAG: phosphate/phosphite/phosphonate ABC transporter substrate-binding protein [Lachnospiraceae bacterium]|nr:phosphate/phosphite/phosphonate ABC transporter substrate-binding protein [Lachnospiraceae bacterium]
MKKVLALALTAAMSVGILAGCGSTKSTTSSSKKDNKNIDKLSIAFVPSREPDEIITATEPLKNLLKDELKKEGYNVGSVDISVGTSFDAVGQALVAGTTDIGVIPGSTYVLYDDGADVILTATRKGLNNDSDSAKDWNDNKPTTAVDKQATSYRALMIAGPSAKGKELADKVNNGKKLTWDDLNSANWSIMSSTSPAGYVYPSLWLSKHYKHNITELSHAVQADSYGTAFAQLASGQVDVVCCYADARRDYESKWNDTYGMTNSIWDDTNVIGVTPAIYNDTISVSKKSPNMSDGLKKALQTAFINIAKTDEGKQVIAIYSHEGYKIAKSSDYDSEREAQKLIEETSSK